jgi:erythromycin esterase-like protein
MNRLFLAFFLSLVLVNAASATEAKGAPASVASWLRQQSQPLNSVDPKSGYADLEPLRDEIGQARLVSLGECTHGSREIFQVKHRLAEYLVSKLGFSLFAIEGNLPETRRINAYIQGGDGDPVSLIEGMDFWGWDTEEILAMVNWMRQFNLDAGNRATGRSVEFAGFDMQEPALTAASVWDFVAANLPALLPQTEAACQAVRTTIGPLAMGYADGILPAAIVRGHHVVFSGWIRTERIRNGWAGLWMKAVTPDSPTVGFQNMRENGPQGTAEWKHYAISIDVPANAVVVPFGMLMTGTGSAWFEGLQAMVDGRPLTVGQGSGYEKVIASEVPFFHATSPYQVELSNESHAGRQSLRICSLPGAVPAADALLLWKKLAAALELATANWPEPRTTAADWAHEYAQVVIQRLETQLGVKNRDQCMAENVEWLARMEPGKKIIIWTHNIHTARISGRMGHYLDQYFGNGMVAIGSLTGRGEYRAEALDGSGVQIHLPLVEPVDGSVEQAFAATGLPRFIVDIRPARMAGSPGKWLLDDHLFRVIGDLEMKNQFGLRRVASEYDLLIWLENTGASTPLPRGSQVTLPPPLVGIKG